MHHGIPGKNFTKALPKLDRNRTEIGPKSDRLPVVGSGEMGR